MRSTNLAFELDYLYDMDDQLFNKLTNDYVLKVDNYSVGYMLLPILDKIRMCEHSQLVDDCWFPYSWSIFITCMPKDIDRIRCIANRIPSSIPANIRIYDGDEENEVLNGDNKRDA